MTEQEKAAQEMRREILGQCLDCGDGLPAPMVRYRLLASGLSPYVRRGISLCNKCFMAGQQLP